MEKALVSDGCSKVKDRCKFDKDYPYGYGYPWPPRNYTCSFCQREFKSAQALGGHMNIHRRDRAKLRAQSPNRDDSDQNPNLSSTPNRNPYPKPDPNPDHQTTTTAINSVWILPNWDTSNPNNYHNPANLPPSSSQTNKIYSHQYSLVSLSLSSLQPSTKDGKNLVEALDLGRDFQGDGEKCKDLTSLEAPPPHGHHHDHNQARVSKINGLELRHGEPKEDLDLELRLGI